MSATVLLIEDDETLRELLSFHVDKAGFQVLEADCAGSSWPLLSQADVVVLDWMLPDESGIEWLRRFRQWQQASLAEDVPVLMLTARASEQDKVTGLNAGADDYLTKPFSAPELVARLHALLRRRRRATRYSVGDIAIDEEQASASFRGAILRLSRREFDLLVFFVGHPDRVYSRSQLLDKVWGEDFVGTERTVDQHVAQLRALLGQDYIATVRGKGYKLVNPYATTH